MKLFEIGYIIIFQYGPSCNNFEIYHEIKKCGDKIESPLSESYVNNGIEFLCFHFLCNRSTNITLNLFLRKDRRVSPRNEE